MGISNASSTLTEQLIEHCQSEVEDSTRQRAAVHLLDWLGCALAGQATDIGGSLRQYSRQFTPTSGIAFNATGTSLSALDAAFTNGGLGNILEMDDLHRQSLLHTGDTVVPAALAVAQEMSADTTLLFDAIVKGYEVAIQIGLLAASNGYSAWYNSSTCGVFGAGMAASVLLQLNDVKTSDTLGQCGMMAAGLWQCRLEDVYSKQLATANATRTGVMAAMLASDNFPGPKRILEGELGFLTTLYPSATPALVSGYGGTGWRINEVSFKPWPSCRHTHPAIEAALKIAEKININEVSTIEIGSYRSAIEFCDNPTPATDHEARFSLQHCVASTLLRGTPQPMHFNETARNDNAHCKLVSKVSLVEDEELQQAFPGLFGGRVMVRLADGGSESVTVSCAKGDPEAPMSLEEISQKFYKLAIDAGVQADTATDIVALLTDPEETITIQALSKQLHNVETQLEDGRNAVE